MANEHTKHEQKLKKELEKKTAELELQKDKLREEKELAKSLEHKLKKEASEFRKQFAERTLKLVTSGFGLVSALAWNELIKEFIKIYIQPFFGESSGLISLLIYAVVVTFLAVFVTYQLSKFAEEKEE